MIGEILSLIPSIVGLFSSNSAHDDYSKKLDEVRANQKLSNSALQAKSILAENATRGLAGYDTMKEDINNQLPTTLNEAKDWLSGAGAVDFLAKSKASTDQQLRQLNAANEQTKQNNLNAYANYLGGAMASKEDALMGNRTDVDLAKAGLDYNQSVTNNKMFGNLVGTVGNLADMDWKKIIAGLSGKGDESAGTFGDIAGPTQIPVNRMQSKSIDPWGNVDPFNQTGEIPLWLQKAVASFISSKVQ